jgi:cellulose synthase/poly-beta-1,6-N-acetylglucosamine synthase-like glycosyltransferase
MSGGDGGPPRPVVSVIIPVGRVDDELAGQLDALAAQTYGQPWELICSLNTDDRVERIALEELLGQRPGLRWRIVDSSDLRSASHARNVGAQAAHGSLLAFCDGDDLAEPDWLEEIVRALGETAAVGGHLDETLLAIPGQEGWRPPATPGALPTFLDHPFLVTANMGLRREAFETVGGFNTSLIRGEDVAFSWDLTTHGIGLAYAPAAVVHYRHRKGLWPMMRQHYLYGRGFSQIMARQGPPGGTVTTSLRALKPNGQATTAIGPVYFLRRGSIAVGRVVGLLAERAVLRRRCTQ